MKNSIWVVLLAALITLSFSVGQGLLMLDVTTAYAGSDRSKDDNSKAKKSEDSKSKEKKSEDSKSKEKKSEDSKSSDDEKVTVCHVPPGNPDNAHNISVAESAVSAHLAHGDVVGECPVAASCICPAGVSSCVCPDGTAGGPGPASAGSPASQREIHGQ
ncbi:hypothetical protein MMIC_P2238 [Mariprofundus micogutta]|uniref:Uncharacterized protein n=1 Tax=Mariprofundus micogutta TaxID=1921010 RepID=A0A1L8CQP6_9PROT|nr:hypothetical protein [Mariprofundus micogutta]GAV21256.1 hypothetical protein MMIC_P2238 [Mariprofundus micogutta]